MAFGLIRRVIARCKGHGIDRERAQQQSPERRCWLARVRRLVVLLMGLAAGLVQGAEPVERIDFKHPQRSYLRCPGQAGVFHEQEAGEEKAALSASACRKFAEHQAHVLQQLPASARPFFNGVNVFLMLGEKSALGGHRSGMRFVRQGEPRDANGYDPRWAHGIVVYSSTNLMHLSGLWTRKAILQEMAHAWHIGHWPERHPPILSAWQQAMDRRLYRDVQDVNGKLIPTAYATTNQLEYFAELSAAYFVGINHFPFDREGLRRYDPAGAAMVEAVWSLR